MRRWADLEALAPALDAVASSPLAIVAYGGFIANVHLVDAKHPTLLFWFWAVVIGFVAYVCVAGLLLDDD